MKNQSRKTTKKEMSGSDKSRPKGKPGRPRKSSANHEIPDGVLLCPICGHIPIPVDGFSDGNVVNSEESSVPHVYFCEYCGEENLQEEDLVNPKVDFALTKRILAIAKAEKLLLDTFIDEGTALKSIENDHIVLDEVLPSKHLSSIATERLSKSKKVRQWYPKTGKNSRMPAFDLDVFTDKEVAGGLVDLIRSAHLGQKRRFAKRKAKRGKRPNG